MRLWRYISDCTRTLLHHLLWKSYGFPVLLILAWHDHWKKISSLWCQFCLLSTLSFVCLYTCINEYLTLPTSLRWIVRKTIHVFVCVSCYALALMFCRSAEKRKTQRGRAFRSASWNLAAKCIPCILEDPPRRSTHNLHKCTSNGSGTVESGGNSVACSISSSTNLDQYKVAVSKSLHNFPLGLHVLHPCLSSLHTQKDSLKGKHCMHTFSTLIEVCKEEHFLKEKKREREGKRDW